MQVGKILVICSVLLLSASQVLAQDEPAWEGGETEAPVSDEASTEDAEPAGESGTSGPGGIKDRGVHERPYGISGMLYLPWYFGIGIGVNARFEIPIVHDGFISSINDQVSIEPSFSLGYRTRSYGFATDRLNFFDITPAVYGMWSFHITPKFRPYGAIGLGYAIGIWLNDDDYPGRDVTGGFFYWDTAVGLFYNFSETIAFRCEIGAQGPKAGLSIFF